MLRHLTISRLPVRLYALVALFGVGLLALIGLALVLRWEGMRAQRVEQMEAMTEVASRILESNRAEAIAGRMSEDAAKARAISQVVAMTYGNGNYFIVIDDRGTIQGHPNPKVIGIDAMTQTDTTGFRWNADVFPRARRDGVATVEYWFPRLGATAPSHKLGVYRSYAPWHWMLTTGTYMDDLTAAFADSARQLLALGAGLMLLLLVAATLIIRSIVRPVAALSQTMVDLAAGTMDGVLPTGGSLSETKAMAASVRIFQEAAIAKTHLEAATAEERQTIEADRTRRAATVVEQQRLQQVVVSVLANGLERLSKGDLTESIDQPFAQDYEQLRTDFNSTAASLKEALRTIADAAGLISSGSTEIAKASDDLSRRTEQQAASLEETAAALSEVTAAITKTASGAAHAREVVAVASNGAERSGDVVSRTIGAMAAIEQSSRRISQIIGVIDEIAFQTNLLALNAGVEAARAGDAGRGFAVVASEVRGLAQRSAEAAKEIKALIRASEDQVKTGVQLVGETGEGLTRIVQQVAEISVVVSDIARSANEQATGLSQVNIAVTQMDQVVQQNAAMVEETTAAAHALKGDADELAAIVGRFQIDDGASARSSDRARDEHPVRALRARMVASGRR